MNKLLLTFIVAVTAFAGATAETVNRAYAIRMWADNVEGNRPALVSFDLTNPGEIREELSLDGHYFRSGVCVDRNYYLIDSDDQMVPYRLLKVNIDTHKVETVTEYGLNDYEGGLIFQDMTYDATTGNVYALAYDIDGGSMSEDQELDIPLGFFTFDITTGKATLVRHISGDINLITLSTSPYGDVCAISDQGILWDIQKISGRVGDPICETGLTPGTVQSAEFCATDGCLYWTGFYATSSDAGIPIPNGFFGRFTFGEDMVTFDRLANMPHNEELIALFIDPSPVDRNAPGEVLDLVVTPDASGAQSATLSWLNPDCSVGNEALSENITIDIYRNDDLVASISDLVPGSNGEYIDNIGANGNVMYHVVARNSAGTGRATYSKTVFIGHDLPAEVQNLKAQRTGTGYDISISWSAPVAGANGGWLDESGFVYNVVRYPDGMRIATATNLTSLTDNNITASAGYYYAVTAINTDGEGTETFSNTVISGPALDIPYSCDFSTPDMARQWTVVDADNDGQTFYHETTSANGEWFMKFFPDRELGPDVPADDWLISSPIHFEAGATYALHYKVRTLGMLFPLNFDVTIGSGITADAQSRVLNSYTDFGHEMKWYDNTELITVDATGDYCVGFHVTNAVSASFSFVVIEELPEIELEAVNVAGNLSPVINTADDYVVTIKNNAATTASDYTVKLVDATSNSVLVSEKPGVAIEPQTTAEITIQWTPAATGNVSLKAVVEIEGDVDTSNNATSPLDVTVLANGEWIDLSFNNREIGYTPVDLRSPYSMTQTIYDMDVINVKSGGTISAITYPYRVAYEVEPIDVAIYLANVDKADFSDRELIPTDAFTKVYEGPLTLPLNGEQSSANFDAPFEYSGGYLCIMVEYVGGVSRKGIFFKAYQDNNWNPCLATYGGATRFDFTQSVNFYQDRASLSFYIESNTGAAELVTLGSEMENSGEIYDITGKLVNSFTDGMPQLTPGIYIVKTATSTRKIAVR